MDGRLNKPSALRHPPSIPTYSLTHIASAKTRNALGKLEQQLVEQFDTVEHGYNQTRGGNAGEAVGRSVTVKGKTYISVSAAARAFGVGEHNVRQRISRYGWTLEQALGLTPSPRRKPTRSIPYSLLGKGFLSFRAACESYGLEESVVRSRLKIG